MAEPSSPKYDRDLVRFECTGLDLNRPVDSVRPGKWPFLKNVRAYTSGVINPSRPGLTSLGVINPGATPTHSVRRLNDPQANDFTYIIGAGTTINYGKATPFTASPYAGGVPSFSGNPLALVPYRPDQSPRSWMYIGDSNPSVAGAAAGTLTTTLKKIRINGELHQFGMPAPTAPLTNVVLAAPSYNFSVPDMDFEYVSNATLQAAWVAAGTAGAATLVARVSTTITAIKYDTGTTGWACVQPASMAQLGHGVILDVGNQAISAATNAVAVEFTTAAAPPTGTKVYISGFTAGWVGANGSFTATHTGATKFTIPVDSSAFGAISGTPVWGEMQVVQEIHEVSTTTTIGSISYDTGVAGLCSIVLTTPVNQIGVNAMMNNSTIGEYVRILSVNSGPDGTVALRCSTTGTFAAGNTVQLVGSFRIYLAATHAAAETVTAQGATTAVATGSGTLTRTAAYDFSIIATGLPAGPEDYIHVSMRADVPSSITEIKMLFDVDSATNDFTRNFYYKAIRPNDLTPSARNLQPLITTGPTVVQRDIIDNSLIDTTSSLPAIDVSVSSITDTTPTTTDNTSQQLDLGDVQWTEVFFRVSDLIRVGTDDSRTLANIAAVRFLITVTGTVNFAVDDIWLGGGYGPDVVEPTGIPYLYRYRARASQTGAVSNPSPPFRGGITAYRQKVVITPPAYAKAPVSEADLIDFERFGGEIPSWHYIGSALNNGSSFSDTFADDVISPLPDLGVTSFQPWPVIGLPATGTTASVVGTTVNDAAANFDTRWAQGIKLQINGITVTLYQVISTSKLEIFENLGTLGAVPWVIGEPLLVSQPLPCLWMSLEDNVWFGLGDNTNPGRLYWTEPGSEGTTDQNWKDVTSPSEPLMNGVHYNGRDYVWSTERMWQIFSRGRNSNGILIYDVQEIPNGKGLFARWAITLIPGPQIQFLARDGIYTTGGGTPVSITDEWLYPLFPTEAQTSAAVNGVKAPDVSSTNNARLRLNYCVDYLYFDYLDVNNNAACLVYVPEMNGWFYDEYGDGLGVVFHYGEEGVNVREILTGDSTIGTSLIYQFTGNTDNLAAIQCAVQSPSRDQGDARENKLYGDIMVDVDPQGVAITATPGTNNYGTTYAATTLNFTGRDQRAVPLGSAWATARNIAIRFTWSVNSASKPVFYIWEPRWTFESAPISAIAWEISPSTFGAQNFKFFGQGRLTRVSNVATPIIVTVDGVAQTAVNIPSSGGVYDTYVFRFPVYKGKLYKLRIAPANNSTEWRLDTRDSYIEVKEWGAGGPFRKMRVFGDFSFIEG